MVYIPTALSGITLKLQKPLMQQVDGGVVTCELQLQWSGTASSADITVQ